MIHLVKGNLFDSKAEALVNTVNTVGVMGKGIALQFKMKYPKNFNLYFKACKEKTLEIGNLLITENDTDKKIIINFPTKKHWRNPSRYEYIEKGLKRLVDEIKARRIKSIAIPPLGAGNGGLDWKRVKSLIEQSLLGLECEIFLYEPNEKIQEVLKEKKVSLTPARAMLLYVLYDLVRNGEFVSEFASEKIAYFLQRFGAEEEFNLEFKPCFYGPYSGKVKHVLHYLDGSYITGYFSNDKKPFEEINLVMSAEKEVFDYLSGSDKYLQIAEKTKSFLAGYYSPFALELLSSVDFVSQNIGSFEEDEIIKELSHWSIRKSKMFSDKKYVNLALKKVAEYSVMS